MKSVQRPIGWCCLLIAGLAMSRAAAEAVPGPAAPTSASLSVPSASPDAPSAVFRLPSPDGRWELRESPGPAGFLEVARPSGPAFPLRFPGGKPSNCKWAVDSRAFAAVTREAPADPVVRLPPGQLTIWRVDMSGDLPGRPARIYSCPEPPDNPSQIQLGPWAPGGKRLVFWMGMLGASILADGLPVFILEVDTGEARKIADAALLDPRYYAWSPDGKGLLFTAGSGRFAGANKWLLEYTQGTLQVLRRSNPSELIPGAAAWCPNRRWVAFAAARKPGVREDEWSSAWDNPGVANRRIYILDLDTGKTRRLNDADAFQDQPVWSGDGAVLHYVQKEESDLVLMAADPVTGKASPLEASRKPAPPAAGYYGRMDWEEWAAFAR